MLKLKTLITEQEFKAKSKETGRVVVYKSKDSMDKAIKGGRAEPLDKKTIIRNKSVGKKIRLIITSIGIKIWF